MLGGEYEGGVKHWIDFLNVNPINDNRHFYLTLTVDLENDSVSLYSLGSIVGTNKCNEEYLDSNLICNDKIPFTMGLMTGGSTPSVIFSKFLLYGCRLYDRVLSEKEIKLNYNESKSLLEN